MISLLLPTRKRIKFLSRCLESLKGSDSNDYEVIFRLDDDDSDTLDYVKSLDSIQKKIIVGPRLGGYADLHVYYNECCEIAEGDFLWLFNDDITIKEKNIDWASIMLEYKDREIVLDIVSYYTTMPDQIMKGMFPAMHRKLYEVLGHFSLNNHNDSYLIEVFRKGNPELWKILETPSLWTYRNEMGDDITGLEAASVLSKTTAAFGSLENTNNILKDIQKIKNYLKK